MVERSRIREGEVEAGQAAGGIDGEIRVVGQELVDFVGQRVGDRVGDRLGIEVHQRRVVRAGFEHHRRAGGAAGLHVHNDADGLHQRVVLGEGERAAEARFLLSVIRMTTSFLVVRPLRTREFEDGGRARAVIGDARPAGTLS